jgi:HD-GYP domain-containing protein (c-di-GMP phosphodiesterase class II)
VVDAKSPYTSGHSNRVAAFTALIAEHMGVAPAALQRLRRAALLHDVGKLGVSNAILDKPGKLDNAEWGAMREHALHSESILGRIPAFAELAEIGGAHHERLDGRGYPRGIEGGQIGALTRIVSVADVCDALTADRPYRAAMAPDRMLSIMSSDVGKAFDPACFEALRTLAAEGRLVAERG